MGKAHQKHKGGQQQQICLYVPRVQRIESDVTGLGFRGAKRPTCLRQAASVSHLLIGAQDTVGFSLGVHQSLLRCFGDRQRCLQGIIERLGHTLIVVR